MWQAGRRTPGVRRLIAVQDDFRRQPASAITRCDTREFLDDCPARITELFHY